MRKVLVVLLAALLLLSFTSCNQDKIDDLEAQVAQEKADNEAMFVDFENFKEAYIVADLGYFDGYDYFAKAKLGDGSYDLNPSSNCSDLDFLTRSLIWKPFITLEEGETIEICSGGSITASGKITGSSTTESGKLLNANLKLKDNTFKAKYTVYKDSVGVSGKEDIEIAITLNGEMTKKVEGKTETRTFNVTVTSGDKSVTYNFSYTQNTETKEFTAAKVNGNAVELRLLNASI